MDYNFRQVIKKKRRQNYYLYMILYLLTTGTPPNVYCHILLLFTYQIFSKTKLKLLPQQHYPLEKVGIYAISFLVKYRICVHIWTISFMRQSDMKICPVGSCRDVSLCCLKKMGRPTQRTSQAFISRQFRPTLISFSTFTRFSCCNQIYLCPRLLI